MLPSAVLKGFHLMGKTCPRMSPGAWRCPCVVALSNVTEAHLSFRKIATEIAGKLNLAPARLVGPYVQPFRCRSSKRRGVQRLLNLATEHAPTPLASVREQSQPIKLISWPKTKQPLRDDSPIGILNPGDSIASSGSCGDVTVRVEVGVIVEAGDRPTVVDRRSVGLDGAGRIDRDLGPVL